MAESKTVGLLSYRVATRLQSLILPNMHSIRLRRNRTIDTAGYAA
ncbi:hypothetical protein OAN307_c22370 [Octadecabacter antarcticus 307]|uniref:Uncharacterized protein n=1 Tax=Octadecabacter antarcticus 307 TaxID=391626 RepID=M9RBT8_9RHOB|nr:hypothetical protein OAN307_c22370 [Octadecabacter antarcticus 307]